MLRRKPDVLGELRQFNIKTLNISTNSKHLNYTHLRKELKHMFL